MKRLFWVVMSMIAFCALAYAGEGGAAEFQQSKVVEVFSDVFPFLVFLAVIFVAAWGVVDIIARARTSIAKGGALRHRPQATVKRHWKV